MNSSRLYEWEPGNEHAWIAEDVDGYLAYMTCCIDGALPDKVNIDRRMLSGLDLRLKALFDSEQCKVSDWFESFAAFGFFVYDAVRVKNGGFAFRLVARPKVPTKADKLPESLRSVAMVFSVEGVRFGMRSRMVAGDVWRTKMKPKEVTLASMDMMKLFSLLRFLHPALYFVAAGISLAVGQKFARVSLFVIVLESRRFIPEAGKEPPKWMR